MLPSLTDIGGFAATRGCTPCAAYAAIPAHPQKRHTRLWRLYHFCGFCYPIREVIPIAIYHWNIGIVSRGKGKSAVAAAAYRSGEKLTNEWDGMTHDYTRKGGVVHTEIMLPPHAPPSFADRSTLWNSVELYEKAGNAQLAREIDAALPTELSREEQIRLVREYCSSQFVSRGMCVDYAIHDELKKLQNGWTNKRDKYEEAHRAELTLWNAASRYLHAHLPEGVKTLPISAWEKEYTAIKAQREAEYDTLKETRAEVAELQKIRRCVDSALRADQPEQTQSRTKRQEQER